MRVTFVREKLLLVLFGALVGWICYSFRLWRGEEGDFGWALQFASDLLHHADPYAFTPSALLVPYPLPVALFGLPLLWLPRLVAAAVFFGISSGLLAYGALRAGEGWRLSALLSAPFLMAAVFTQWSPLITASAFFPALAPLLVIVKPQVTLPVVACRRPSYAGVAVMLVVLGLSLAVMPTWPLRWLGMLGEFQRMIPLLTLPFGPLLLIAGLRWRDARARLLLLMAVMPQRAIYDLVPLWLVPAHPLVGFALAGLSWIGYAFMPNPIVQPAWSVPLLYLPALLSLFWPRAAGRPEVDRADGSTELTPGGV